MIDECFCSFINRFIIFLVIGLSVNVVNECQCLLHLFTCFGHVVLRQLAEIEWVETGTIKEELGFSC